MKHRWHWSVFILLSFLLHGCAKHSPLAIDFYSEEELKEVPTHLLCDYGNKTGMNKDNVLKEIERRDATETCFGVVK